MIERPIPKEIKEFKEKLVFGLTTRKLISVVLTLGVTIPTYIFTRKYIGDDLASWLCIIIAIPTALIGWYTKNGMNFEEYIVAILRFMFVVPVKRKYQTENFFEELEKLDKEEPKKNKKVKDGNGDAREKETE